MRVVRWRADIATIRPAREVMRPNCCHGDKAQLVSYIRISEKFNLRARRSCISQVFLHNSVVVVVDDNTNNYRKFIRGNNITYLTYCNEIITATQCTVETVCSRRVMANILHKGDMMMMILLLLLLIIIIIKFRWGNLRERDHWGDQNVDGRIILIWILRKWEGVVGTGWSWLRIGTGGGRL